MSSALPWLLVAVPVAGGGALAVAAGRANAIAPAAGVGLATVTFGLAVAAVVVQPAAEAAFLADLPLRLRVDGLAQVFVPTTAAVTLLVLLFSAGELAGDPGRGRFFGLMLLFSGAMLVTVTAQDLLTLLMAWEVMGAMSWALIGHWWREDRRMAAANVAVWTTRLADVGLYLAAGAAIAGAGTLAFDALPGLAGGWMGLATAGVVVAGLGKSAQLPFSFWLARAMEGPSPVSALLHSATMVAAGGYLLLRLEPLLAASGWGADAVAWIGALTALALGAVAVAQRDLKQLLAASTCSQLGFVVLAAGADGIAGGTMQFVAHAATKSLLFLAAGAWLTALGTKDLGALRGAARRYPLVGLTAAGGLLTLAGVPPFSIWVTKDEALAAALERSPALYVVGLAGVVVSAAYAGKALALLWMRPPADAEAGYDTEQRGTRHVGALERAPLVVLATAAAVLGVQALPPVADAYRAALRAVGEPSSSWWELALSAALAVATAGIVGARPGATSRLPAVLGRWLDLERAATLLVARPTMALARRLAAFDDRLLDGEIVDRAIGRGAQRLGRLARRPQTGQLHHYYAQATAGLVVLLVAFWLLP
jgi:NADH:ubiquinone oxidoreductase subunit 5 (subunit L)/multisubunit Na+/H+ antiporter MnhA subunit